MGFLDQLKSQASSLQKQQLEQSQQISANADLVDAKLRQAFSYLNDLCKQLDVIKPASVYVFELHGIGKFDGLMLGDFFADYRRKPFHDREVFDVVTLQYKQASTAALALKKDMPQLIQQCEDTLWRHNLKFTRHDVRDENGKNRWCEFTVPCSVITETSIRGDYEQAKLLFKLKNFERFETVDIAFDAATFSETQLEDFARLIVGEPNRFLAQGQVLGVFG